MIYITYNAFIELPPNFILIKKEYVGYLRGNSFILINDVNEIIPNKNNYLYVCTNTFYRLYKIEDK